jgi:hypothetical protein
MEIACHFKDIREWGELYPDETKTRKGRYHGSSFAVPGFGVTQWVVCGYLIVPEYEHYVTLGLSEQQVIEGCIEYLNKPPPRKKYQRRVRKPLYGDLKLYQFKPKQQTENEQVFDVLLITDQRINKNFWGEGPRIIAPRKRKKRKK